MSTYVPIIVALKSGLIKSDEFVSYTPDKKRKMRLQKKAFFNDFEKETEFGLGWHPVIYKNFGVLLVSDKATEATITEFIDIKTLEDYANLYQNELFQSIGVALTKELLEDIPKALIHDDIWICSNVPIKRRQTPRPYNPSIPHDHRRHLGPTYCIKHMQPTIFIPPDTIVEIDNKSQTGKSKEKGLKLYPRNSLNISEFPKICSEVADTPMWVPINEAVRARTIFDTDFVEYIPDKETVSFSKEETNAEAIQTAETEYNMGGWHPIVIRKGKTYQAYLVSTHCSKFELEIPTDISNKSPFAIGIEDKRQVYNGIQSLENLYKSKDLIEIKGKNQFDNGIQLLNKYAKIYSCKELNVQGIPFNEELFDALNLNLKAKGDNYYLATAFAYTENHPTISKNICGESYCANKFKLIMGLKWIAYDGLGKYKQFDMPIHRLPIRIAIQLPENIMVQINNSQYDGSTEKKALKLKLASKKENND